MWSACGKRRMGIYRCDYGREERAYRGASNIVVSCMACVRMGLCMANMCCVACGRRKDVDSNDGTSTEFVYQIWTQEKCDEIFIIAIGKKKKPKHTHTEADREMRIYWNSIYRKKRKWKNWNWINMNRIGRCRWKRVWLNFITYEFVLKRFVFWTIHHRTKYFNFSGLDYS